MSRVPDIALHRTMANRIGSVDLMVVSPPKGVTALEPATARERRIRLLVPIDEGIVVRAADGAQWLVGRHDLTWVPRWRPAGVLTARTTSIAVVELPVDAVEQEGVSFASLPPRTHPTSPLVQPVREFLLSAVENSVTVEPISAQLFEQMLAEMVESLALEAAGMPATPGRHRPSLYQQGVAHITAFRASPELNPQHVAVSLRVSVRQLQRAFEDAGTTVAAEIRRQRTEAAVNMLADPAFDDLKMPELAARAGFDNDAELRRAVASWTGKTPSHLRERRAPAVLASR